ncbi:MAG: zinc ribbon domain-containing protein [Actinomycetota bacterium]|nr:zinc ribbon domain-containing protein [Actinomycetota bacterium]
MNAAGFIGIVIGIVITVLLIWGYIKLIQMVARAAEKKGRSYRAWFWIAFFFIIPAAVVVAIMGPQGNTNAGVHTAQVATNLPDPRLATLAPNQLPSLVLNSPDKKCPFCGEQILAVAKKCKHCGEFLEVETPAT